MYNQREVILIEYEDGKYYYESEVIDPFNSGKFVVVTKSKVDDPDMRNYQSYVPHFTVYRTLFGDFGRMRYELACFANVDFISMPKKQQHQFVRAAMNFVSRSTLQYFGEKRELTRFITKYSQL